jgi:hypothetical protein
MENLNTGTYVFKRFSGTKPLFNSFLEQVPAVRAIRRLARRIERHAGIEQVAAAECAAARVPAAGGRRGLSQAQCLHALHRQPRRQGKESHLKV